MKSRQVYLLRKSFGVIEAHGPIAALIFYRILFERHPELRPLFKGGIEEQSAKLTAMLGTLLSMLDHAEALIAQLEEMGERHAGYGTRDEHYGAVGAALLAMVKEVLGADFSPELGEAWTALYRTVEQAMKRGASRAPLGAG